jgi:alpha-tubulin suppressor-like RCC1 family protein
VQQKTKAGWKTLTSTASASTRTYTVTRLTNLTSYTFRVAAITKRGVGTYSKTVKGVPRPRPLAPRSVTATPGDGSVTVRWSPPTANGTSRITGYRIQRRQESGSFITVQTVAGSRRSFTLTGLGNGNTQTVRINAISAIGSGPSVTRSVDLPVTLSVAAGENHTCAVMPDTGVICWGANDDGQLGSGSVGGVEPNGVPVIGPDGSTPLRGVASLGLGRDSSCAVLLDGRVACWGANNHGQLGDTVPGAAEGDPPLNKVPRAVIVRTVTDGSGTVALGDVVQVVVGERHACARTEGGTVRCWGGATDGQRGDGTTPAEPTTVSTVLLGPAIDAVTLSGVVEIDAGRFHTCARRSSGSVVCWGDGTFGVLGNGVETDETTARTVTAVAGATGLGTGFDHTCAVVADATALCWGRNEFGAVGNGTTNDPTLVPTAVLTEFDGPALTGIATISGGQFHTCAAMVDGSARCWGYGPNGQLGNGQTDGSTVPVTVTRDGTVDLGGIGSLTTGGDHACVRRALGELRCWGYNDDGQIGDGTQADQSFPQIVRAIDRRL